MSLVIMTIDHRYDHFKTIRSVIASVLYPVEYLAHIPGSTADWANQAMVSRESLLEENKRLHNERLHQKVKLQKLAALERENQRLRNLLDSPAQPAAEKVLVTGLLSVDLHPFKQRVVIDKGRKHGLHVGQPLVGADGLIGQVLETHAAHSIAILISDPNHALLAQINRNGLRVLVEGTGDTSRLQLKYVSASADIEVGDLLVTSGLDGRYPTNYPVAEVTRVEKVVGEAFLQAEARPLVNLLTMREALLLWLEMAEENPPTELSANEPS